MIARNNQVEALRVAAGLVLLDDIVKVVVLGELDDSPAIKEQLEVLEFADVSCELLAIANQAGRLAQEIAGANLVYVL